MRARPRIRERAIHVLRAAPHLDVFTHFVIPYIVVWALRRPHRERLAAGIGGYAPDTDVVTSAAYLLDERIYFLGHRGLSHSLLGAPLYALAVALALSALAPRLARRWPRLAALRFTPAMLVVAVLASFTHLALDFVTMWGVPLLFPWRDARFGLSWFFYSVLWTIPLSFWFCWGLWKGRGADDRFVAKWGALVVAALVLSGAARLAWMPDAPEGGRALPTGQEWQWATVTPRSYGYDIQPWSFGKPGEVEPFVADVPDDPRAAAALEQARASLRGKRFLLYAAGPIAEAVEPTGEGGWNVTLTDLMREARSVGRPDWFPSTREFGKLKVYVDEFGGVRERE